MTLDSFKESDLISQWWCINPRLQEMLIILDNYVIGRYKKPLLITSLIRKDDEHSPHYWGHAADLRIWAFTSDERDEILSYTNQRWVYPKKQYQTLEIHENKDKTGVHWHLQIAP